MLTELKPRIKLVLFLSFVLLVIVSNLMDCKLRMAIINTGFGA